MSLQPKNFYEFGAYRIDARDHLLLRDGEVVPLAPKAFDLLLVLVESSGRVLSKEELMKQIWPDSFVEEANLSRHVFSLRKALGEDGDPNKYIETIPRRGYRFIAGVTEVQDESDELVVAEHSRSRIVIEQSETPSSTTDYNASDQTGRAWQLNPDTNTLVHLGYAYAVSGKRSEAQKAIDQLIELSKLGRVLPSEIAVVYASLGNRDRAFVWLEKSYAKHENLSFLKVDPEFESLRSDPRYAALLQRSGLAL